MFVFKIEVVEKFHRKPVRHVTPKHLNKFAITNQVHDSLRFFQTKYTTITINDF